MKELSIEEVGLLTEMKDRCLNKGLYTDENAEKKFKMLCHLEDFSIQYYELQNNWNKLKKFVEDGIKQHGCGTTMYLTRLLKKMQEMEQGKDD